MSDDTTRIERDSMGTMQVPGGALWGASTQRAVENFPISGWRFPRRFIRALGLVKAAAAEANAALGLLAPDLAAAIGAAADEVVAGTLDAHFVVDVFQTGSGTSTNMNANEVIAHRARAAGVTVHPNDHVNMSQSSNDVIPTAMHLAAAEALASDLLPALRALAAALAAKARELDDVVKIGRTHLQDATPVRLGQELGGYARQVELAITRLEAAATGLEELALGGTAVGTGLNAHPAFAGLAIARLAERTGLPFREAANHFEAQSGKDAVVQLSGTLKTTAVALTKIANDVRWLASGPRCGIGEISIPATQPGSSIMPGKVNPVMAEALLQAAAFVIGADLTVTLGGQAGNFELNVMMPIMAHQQLESLRILAAAVRAFTERCVVGIRAERERAAAAIEQSLAMCTALAPIIGYDAAAAIAKESYASGQTVRDIARARQVLPEERLARVLDPLRMTKPGLPE
ncbi:MAG: aspartate ammonia-lyase [Polyangiaceae bacterium UTPRO1]|jgi:fumarate hydratase class II|nr:class II fumarate hydratase [Myxococcales bacterium]OQY68597.1 MAG: aspartate ammonia-lyase [Polyangiaceae bacterium UTPRO1]